MNIPRDQVEAILRGEQGEVVEDQPPEVGYRQWVRLSPKAKPFEIQVVDLWELKTGGWNVMLAKAKPDFELPKKPAEESNGLRLSQEQRSALFAGDHRALTFDLHAEPSCDSGDTYVLLWSRTRRIYDGTENSVTEVPRQPLLWLEITHKVRREDDWMVRFNVQDHRQPVRLPRRVPDPGAPDPEVTSDRKAAVDHLEQVTKYEGASNLFSLVEARTQYRHLHEDRDRSQETRMLAFRLRRARAKAYAQGIDDSREVALIGEIVRELEQRTEGAA